MRLIGLARMVALSLVIGSPNYAGAQNQPVPHHRYSSSLVGKSYLRLIADGDGLRLPRNNRPDIIDSWRIWGIDAPEIGQKCGRYDAGAQAIAYLLHLIQGSDLDCQPVWPYHDKYGRSLGICRADGVDVGREMVRAGHALAFVRYTSYYVPEETEARLHKRGMHGHDCQAPWDYRQSSKDRQKVPR